MVPFYLMMDREALSRKEECVFIERCQTHSLQLACSLGAGGAGACAAAADDDDDDDDSDEGRRGRGVETAPWKCRPLGLGSFCFVGVKPPCLPPWCQLSPVTAEMAPPPGSLP